MTNITVSGKTIEEAVSKALTELQTTHERLQYKVIEQPQKGFLGLIGNKPAKIEAFIKPDPVEVAYSFLKATVQEMGFNVEIEIETKQNVTHFNVKGEQDMGRLIGKRGQTLDSLEYLTNLVANKQDASFVRIQLDTENYRAKRIEALEQLAIRVRDKVLSQQKKVALEPMNASERKVIHSRLQHTKGVRTISEGKGPRRHITVTPDK